MRHLGDITKISGGEIRPVDVVIGGSPCQNLSIAGKRAGLVGEQSGLYMEQIRIIKELRDADRRRGRTGQHIRPRFMVWENVPGAFSCNKGEDFRAVLEEAARVTQPDAVIPGHAGGKWRNSGAILGDGWSIAWRVLDAQFWGVPQRRRRIALVVDFGGYAAPEVLFVRKGVWGDIDESEAAGEAPAAVAGGGAYPTVARSLTARYDGSPCADRGPNIVVQAAAFSGGQGEKASGIGYAVEVSPTLRAAASGSNRSPCVLAVAENQRNELRTSDVYPSISTGGGKPRRGCPCICIQCNTVDRNAQQHGAGLMEELSYTLDATDRHAAAVFENHGQDGRLTGPLETAPTVARKFGTGGNNTPLVMATGQGGAEVMEDCSPTLNCNHESPIVTGLDCRNGTENQELSATLQAKANGGQSLNCTHPVRIGKAVRRLTPLECERLQGFPDGWTDIGPWRDSKGKLHKESSDSARYKALGNSIALPPWRWVLIRLSALYERPAMLGSLFDGIGGFPLLWEGFNGPGSCLWASEIEEFPMAVTRFHFKDS